MNKKVKWGNDMYDYYKTSDGKYDILHMERKSEKDLDKSAFFPTKEHATMTSEEATEIVTETLARLFI